MPIRLKMPPSTRTAGLKLNIASTIYPCEPPRLTLRGQPHLREPPAADADDQPVAHRHVDVFGGAGFIERHAPLIDQPARLAVGRREPERHKQMGEPHRAVLSLGPLERD